MKIGLVGEAPNDTASIRILLEKQFEGLTIFPLLRNVKGSELENQKNKHRLNIECRTQRPDVVIFIRDLDGINTSEFREQRLLRQRYFKDFKGSTGLPGDKVIYLLNIYELEALILADIDSFNSYYGCDVEFAGDPMMQEEPKEFLYDSCKFYSNSHNSKILEQSNLDKIRENCLYFDEFMTEMEKIIGGE